MLTPDELYSAYSKGPCESTNDELRGDETNGAGTPYYFSRIIKFLKHVKYPCFSGAPNISDIVDTGKNKLGLTFKFLQELDIGAYSEIQPSIRSGTAHSIRNACDTARACDSIINNAVGTVTGWNTRMATEYIERYGENSLPDCLMVLGPDLVPPLVASTGRAPGVNTAIPNTYSGMPCIPNDGIGAIGARRNCVAAPTPPGGTPPRPKCRSCGFCILKDDGEPLNPNDPCCKYRGIAVPYTNYCCGAPMTSRADFSYIMSDTDTDSITRPSKILLLDNVDNMNIIGDWTLNSTTLSQSDIATISSKLNSLNAFDIVTFRDDTVWAFTGSNAIDSSRIGTSNRMLVSNYTQYSKRLRHAGLLDRKIYGGYANLLDNSGSNFYAISDDIFLEYCQNNNGWDYTNNNTTTTTGEIYRAQTISLVLDASATDGKSPTTNAQSIVDRIKDLLWNGHGVVLFSNVGFPNARDSSGVAYPDRIWYHTYAIIGYDDTKREFDECVYVLSSPWGDWISGGNPSWGPLPPGCFLVKETHLKCMVRFYPDRDYLNCKSKLPCNPILYDCDDPSVVDSLSGCGDHSDENKCEPYRCYKQQGAFGLVFAISLKNGFPKQTLDHKKYYPVSSIKETFKEQTLYYKYP
jgi:hypothetical protein